jgi:hypothetical protein
MGKKKPREKYKLFNLVTGSLLTIPQTRDHEMNSHQAGEKKQKKSKKKKKKC